MRKTHQRRRASIVLLEAVQWLLIVGVVAVAILHFQPSTDKNTCLEKGRISNISNVHTKNREWIFFDANGKSYYFTMMDRSRKNREWLMQSFLQAERENGPVELGVINQTEWLHFSTLAGREKVVSISSSPLSISSAEFNRDQIGKRIMLLCIASVLTSGKLLIYWCSH